MDFLFKKLPIAEMFFCLCCSVLREQWIRAKYERQEFTEQNKLRAYSSGKPVALRPTV